VISEWREGTIFGITILSAEGLGRKAMSLSRPPEPQQKIGFSLETADSYD
jgi:hypothetical protein